jgi:hypothetical protein
MLPAEFDRVQVVQAPMQSNCVVMLCRYLDQDARLATDSEPFCVQVVDAQAPVEALVRVVLAGLTGLDFHGLDPVFGHPQERRTIWRLESADGSRMSAVGFDTVK